MRIAFLVQDIGAIYGAERATLSLVQELTKSEQVSVHVLLMQETRLPSTNPVLFESFCNAGAVVESIPVQHAFSMQLIRTIRAALAQHQIDLLHTVGYKADLHGLMAACQIRLPLVSTVHGWLFRPDLKERIYEHLNLLTLRRFSKIIVLSRFYEDLMRRKGISGDRIERIPSGMIAEADRPPPSRGTSLTIGMLGRLSYEKNQQMFLRAIAAMRKRNLAVTGIIAGSGPDQAAIAAEIEDRGLANCVSLRGYMNAADFFCKIDVLALCSRIENLSYSVLEAMAHGIPVVATRVGGLPDLIEDGVTGYLVSSDDDIMFADRIDTLAQRPDLREQMGFAGQRKLRKEFRADHCAQNHIDLYQRLNASISAKKNQSSMGRKG